MLEVNAAEDHVDVVDEHEKREDVEDHREREFEGLEQFLDTFDLVEDLEEPEDLQSPCALNDPHHVVY